MDQLLPTCFLVLVTVLSLEGSPYAAGRVSGGSTGDHSYRYNTMGQRVDNGLVGSSQQRIDWGLMDKPVKIIKGTSSGGQIITQGIYLHRVFIYRVFIYCRVMRELCSTFINFG
jgi:hypothetical protein